MAKLRSDRARFGLRGPHDLIKKLEHDIRRLVTAQKESREEAIFASFDCAVTAWSLVDWLYESLTVNERKRLAPPDGTKAQFTTLIKGEVPHLDICRQIATGAKHFNVDSNPDPDLDSGVSEIGKIERNPATGNKERTEIQYLPQITIKDGSIFVDEFFSFMDVDLHTFMRTHGIYPPSGDGPFTNAPPL